MKALSGMEKLERYLNQQDKVDNGGSKLLREIVYERLVDAFRRAGLQPGDVLSEARLSKILKASRTPVREALQQLAKEGFIQIIPGRAITVAAPSVREVLDALYVRQLLEPIAARMAAETFSPVDCDNLQAVTLEMEDHASTGSRAAWAEADIRWHEILNGSCPNRLLGQFVLRARNIVYGQGITSYLTAQDLIDGTLQHRRVVDAICLRDGEAAERLMLEHLRNVGKNLMRRLGRF